MALGMDIDKLKSSVIEVLRYARFITGINPLKKERYYRLQVFFTSTLVKSVFLDNVTLDTISKAIKSGAIPPITFIEPTYDDVEFKNEDDLKYE